MKNLAPNFRIEEFVHSSHFKIFGESSIQLLDIRIIKAAQAFRTYIGKPVILNNWHSGGPRIMSGLRPFDSDTGAMFSQHKFGRAIDIVVAGMSGDELREIARKEYAGRFNGLFTTIEQGTDTWLHLDCRYTGQAQLLEVPYWKPNK